MKKVFIVLIIVIGVVALFYFWNNNSAQDKAATPFQEKNSSFKPDPSNATFNIDDEEVILSGGRKNTSTEETNILDKLAYGDVNADGKEDTILFLVQSGGGSGTFIYLAGYISGPVTYRGSTATFIGDRIVPQSISISKGVVTIKYLDRGTDDAFATEPTIQVSKEFIFKDGEFVER